MLIKDLSTSVELDHAAMTAVHGGSYGNSNVSGILQGLEVITPVTLMAGPGSAVNNFVTVDVDQSAHESTNQKAGDKFSFAMGLLRSLDR